MDKIRLFYEIEMMKRLDHPNILKLCEIFQDEKWYFLVTELCTGGDLHDEIVRRGKFSEINAAEII